MPPFKRRVCEPRIVLGLLWDAGIVGSVDVCMYACDRSAELYELCTVLCELCAVCTVLYERSAVYDVTVHYKPDNAVRSTNRGGRRRTLCCV